MYEIEIVERANNLFLFQLIRIAFGSIFFIPDTAFINTVYTSTPLELEEEENKNDPPLYFWIQHGQNECIYRHINRVGDERKGKQKMCTWSVWFSMRRNWNFKLRILRLEWNVLFSFVRSCFVYEQKTSSLRPAVVR